jgi:hypothetical protein
MRRKSSVKAFNEYVNELISEYQSTGEIKSIPLARKYECSEVYPNRFNLMSLGGMNRQLSTEETESIYRHIRQPKEVAMPTFSDTSTETKTPEPIMDELPFDTSEEQVIIKEENTEIATHTPNGWFANIISKTKSTIANLLMRKKVGGFYLQWAKADDGTAVFAWVNRHHKIDYVLRINGNEVIECGAVCDDAELQSLNFDNTDKNQLFRVVFHLKHLLHEAQRENEIYKAKLNAIAEILVMEDGKL